MTKKERLNKREQIRQEIIKEGNIFGKDYPIEKFEKYINEFLDTYTSDELLEELIDCGLEIEE